MQDKNGNTPLHLLLGNPNLLDDADLVGRLTAAATKRGCVNVLNGDGVAPLHLAAALYPENMMKVPLSLS